MTESSLYPLPTTGAAVRAHLRTALAADLVGPFDQVLVRGVLDVDHRRVGRVCPFHQQIDIVEQFLRPVQRRRLLEESLLNVDDQ